MKRFLGAMCVAAALLLMPGRVEAGPIYVGFVDYCEVGACFGNADQNIDVVNASSFDFSSFGYDYSPGSINTLVLTVESAAGSEQFVYGLDTCAPGSSPDFFASGAACVAFEPLHVDESARLLFSAFSIAGFLSATVTFAFDGVHGDMARAAVDAVDYTAELTATRAAPEPATLLLFGTAAAVMARRRRRQ